MKGDWKGQGRSGQIGFKPGHEAWEKVIPNPKLKHMGQVKEVRVKGFASRGLIARVKGFASRGLIERERVISMALTLEKILH